MPDMRQISTSKGSQHPTKPNETYIGKVRHVNSTGTVAVTIPKLNVVIDNCKVLYGPYPLQKNDRVVCGFLDGQQREMVVYGAYEQTGGTGGSSVYISPTAPVSPVAGQIWFNETTGDTLFYYDNTWVELTEAGPQGATVYVGSSAPASPAEGQIWFNETSGDTLFRYDDTWVELTEAGPQGAQGASGPVAGSANQVVYKDGSNNPAGSSDFTFSSAKLTIGGSVSAIQYVENWSISATAATGTVNVDTKTSTAFYYTSNSSANWTFNFRGNTSTTLASVLTTGESLTVAFAVTNGGTAYYPTAFQIDGNAITPKWQGGTAPSSGNTSSVDLYVFSIVKTAATPTYTVFASQTKFA